MAPLIENTKNKIYCSLNHLLEKYPVEQIHISMICKEAKVSRTSFYKYFKRTEDVLSDMFCHAFDDSFHQKTWTIQYLFSDGFINDFVNFLMNTQSY